METKKDNNRIGVAGECYVAAKLSEMGYYIAFTAKNTVGIDILVSNGSHCKNIQVKTTRGSKPDWWCTGGISTSPDFVYIFVCLNDSQPDYYIVSGKDVDKYMHRDAEDHYKFRDTAQEFKNRWENLKLPLEEQAKTPA